MQSPIFFSSLQVGMITDTPRAAGKQADSLDDRDQPEFFSGGCPDSLYFDSALERPSVFPALFEDPEHVCEHACQSDKSRATFNTADTPRLASPEKSADFLHSYQPVPVCTDPAVLKSDHSPTPG